MNWKDEEWLLAVFDELLERGNAEELAMFFKENPEINEMLERIWDGSERGSD